MDASVRDAVYRGIPGWFDFADVYQAQIDRLSDGARIVETGVYLGKSTAFLAAAIARSGKQIAFDAIDTFNGISREDYAGIAADDDFTFDDQEALRGADGTLYAEALDLLAPVLDFVNVRKADALAAAAGYPDASLDFVFLDDSHTTPHVLAELSAWWPKIKPGGVLAGHDYDWASVDKAVTIWGIKTGRHIQKAGARSWACTKPEPGRFVVPAGERRCLVAVCCNERNVPTRTAESLARIGWGSRVTDAAARHGFQTVDFMWSNKRVLVSDLRDDAVMAAQAGGYTHLLFLDADMVWPNDVLDKMLRHHARGIVAGLYHLKFWPHWPVALKESTWNDDDQNFDYTYDKHAPHTDLLRPEQLVGMGCTLIPMEVFRRFERPWFKYQQNSSGISTITEDVWFCQEAAKAGCPIWLDPTVSCLHIGQDMVSSAHYDRATYEMTMLASGQRLGKTETADDAEPVAVPA